MQALPRLLNSTLTILQTIHAACNITCTFLTIALRDSEMITAKEILCSSVEVKDCLLGAPLDGTDSMCLQSQALDRCC